MSTPDRIRVMQQEEDRDNRKLPATIDATTARLRTIANLAGFTFDSATDGAAHWWAWCGPAENCDVAHGEEQPTMQAAIEDALYTLAKYATECAAINAELSTYVERLCNAIRNPHPGWHELANEAEDFCTNHNEDAIVCVYPKEPPQ